jgi:hypothetical protein
VRHDSSVPRPEVHRRNWRLLAIRH